ncbi:XAC2610-related protein, partial [Anaerosporobacter sp.]|uniref:XAC2610-related protein n=1 Tax=Anaerosporobacter sp. TaxID=1872529 RepID=UPI00286F8F66
HYYWLWNDSVGQFVENDELMKISDLGSVSICEEEQLLQCYTNYGLCNEARYYKYFDGKFVLVRRDEVIARSDDKGGHIFHKVTEELVDGEMKVTADYYEDMKK